MPDTSVPDRRDAQVAQAILAEANRAHRADFRLNGRLAGGYQSGSWHVVDGAGRRAVLKWSPDRAWSAQVLQAAGVVAKLRAVGYPTPAWLAVGISDGGLPYQIQQFVAGQSPDRVTAGIAAVLIELVESHAGLDPDPGRCWSRYVTARMAELPREVCAIGPAGRDLLDACERLLAGHGPVTLPTEDLVHGDFRPANILLDAGRVAGVVDIEALGSGTRVFDYATLLSADGVELGAQQLIIAAGERVAGPRPLAYCLAEVVLDLAVFVHRRALPQGIASLERLRQLVESLTAT